jgi:Ca2+-binding EF-hand superfamily protein
VDALLDLRAGVAAPRRATLGAAAAWLAAASLCLAAAMEDGLSKGLDKHAFAPAQDTAPAEGCLACHSGIEDMHPAASLSCVDCHGGDPKATTKEAAHVAGRASRGEDERVAPLDADLARRRFENPMDLRVLDQTCGGCHADALEHLRTSLHGTTAGHLSDGYYETGALKDKGGAYAVFPTRAGAAGGVVDFLPQVPEFKAPKSPEDLAAHFGDLTRKECLQCHLWSEGRAVRGRVGFDGEYRGEGCAACHVPYAHDGLSRSRDRTIDRAEPGHPLRHAMVRAAPTETCTSCHWGDATIGMNFRGLAALPPGAPAGPDIPGTTDKLSHRQYFLQDPAVLPPDAHHQRGMHCVDCHTQNDIMGDGRLVGHMEQAVEIDCRDCHGDFDTPATLKTRRGTPLQHLRREGEAVILTSKVDGKEHDVVQVAHLVDPEHEDYSAKAAAAMNAHHAGMTCHACHNAWNPNFLGFHFDRNESLTQLDLLTGRRTPGRVTTQEKVFATWKSLYLGLDEEGRVAPYLTGFSTMGSFTDAKGERVVDQQLPVTQAGLSGMTMIHHQMHTTRKEGRSCVDCHRAGEVYGTGSGAFELARQMMWVADRRGIEAVALDRARIAGSAALSKLVLPDVVDLALDCDPLQGEGRWLYASEGSRGVHAIDVRDPRAPRHAGFIALARPRGLDLAGDRLYVADGPGGLAILDVSTPAQPVLLGRAPTVDAHAVEVRWPHAYVADGAGGLWIFDVRSPIAPRVVGGLPLAPPEDVARIIDLDVAFQPSRPKAGGRTTARRLVACVDERHGLVLVDATEPTRPRRLGEARRAPDNSTTSWRSVVLQPKVDLADRQGGTRTTERDYAYVLEERGGDATTSRVLIYDVSEGDRARRVGLAGAGASGELLVLANLYNPPFLQTMLLACGSDGVVALDASTSAAPQLVGPVAGLRDAYAAVVEAFPLDKTIDESGRPLKDVSHEGSRWLRLAEIERLLDVPAEALFGRLPPPASMPAMAARAEHLRLDRDRSGFLEAEELSGALVALDADGDGRVSFGEHAADVLRAQGDRTRVEIAPAIVVRSRLGPDGDLAKLLDRVDPLAHDADEDGSLSKDEAQRAWFSALDLDASGGLSMSEASRAPGAWRELRWLDARARAAFKKLDADGDGKLSRGETRIADEEWGVLDADRDGKVRLPYVRGSTQDRAGSQALGEVEWPTRRAEAVPMPPDGGKERHYALFDGDKDERLTRRELGARRDLLLALDDDRDQSVSEVEFRARLDRMADNGVDVLADGFRARWDLDGDGVVEAGELPLPAWMWRRIGAK